MKSFLIACLFLMMAQAQAEIPAKDVSFENPRIFNPLKGSSATAGYVKINNSSAKEVTLLLVKADAFKAVELHESLEKDGRMAMQKIDKLTIPAKGSIELKPGGHHIMLFDKTRELKEGDNVSLQFTLNGKVTDVAFKIVPRVAKEEHSH